MPRGVAEIVGESARPDPKFLILSANIDALSADAANLKIAVADLRDRIVRLEAQAQLHEEKAKSAAMAHIGQELFRMNDVFNQRMARFDQDVENLKAAAAKILPGADGSR